jgi:DNA-binding CsgD family transcriptional regulator
MSAGLTGRLPGVEAHMDVTVPARKVRRVLELAHEAQDIPESGARFKHMLSGACGLVGADVGVLLAFDANHGHVPVAGVLEGSDPARAAAALAEYAVQGDQFDILARRVRERFVRGGPVTSCRRQDLIADSEWYDSIYVNEFRRPWGFDHSIYSIMACGPLQIAMSVNRQFGSRPFEADDQALVEVLHIAYSRLVAESVCASGTLTNDSRRGSLSPRGREVLDALLRGNSTKDIADLLGLSPNTVRHYTKAVFRAFQVNSRSELVARWFAGR